MSSGVPAAAEALLQSEPLEQRIEVGGVRPPVPGVLPVALPPSLLEAGGLAEGQSLRVLWWVGRARGIGPTALADLCGISPVRVREVLQAWEKQQCVRRQHPAGLHEETAYLTNGGLLELAATVGLPPIRLAGHLGWRFALALWQTQGRAQIADGWDTSAEPLTAHRRAVYTLLGQAALASRAADLAYWGLRLEQVWLEHEVMRVTGRLGPRPDACLWWSFQRRLWLPSYLEYETGSRRPRQAAAKLPHYSWYAGSAACASTWGNAPLLLIVTPDARYEAQLAEALATELDQLQTDVPVLLTHLRLLEQAHLLAAIWRAPGRGPVTPEERATCWGREDSELLLSRKHTEYLAQASQRNRL